MLEGLGLVGGTPDVGVGGVRLLLAVAVGQVVVGEPLAHLVAAPELVHEVGVQPGLVDAQVGVGEQAVAVEALDVVALERRAVAPDVDAVLVHGADEQRAGDRAAQRRGVEVDATAGADVEGAARDRGEALLDQLAAAVDGAGQLGAVLHGSAGYAGDVGLVVLAQVGGVGAGHGALVAHPGDGDGGVEAPRERDADALADGDGGQNLAHGVRSFCSEWALARARKWRARASPPRGSPADDQDGVVAGDGAEDVGELGLVEGAGEELRGARRRPEDHQVGARLGAHQQLAAQARQALGARDGLDGRPGSSVASLGRHGVHQRAGGRPHLDRVELDEVARQRRLGDVQAAVGEEVGELGLRAHLVVRHQLDDQLVPRVLGRGAERVRAHGPSSSRKASTAFWAWRRFSASSQHDALGAVDHVGVDLLAAVGREAVQEDRAGVGLRHQLGGDLPGPEELDARLRLLLLAHRHPGVGDDDVGAGHGHLGVGLEHRRAAGALGDAGGLVDHRAVGLVARRAR